jgi:large subunit ribosomal protein L15
VAEKLNLSSLKPAAARKSRKRIGRGMGSGKGRYAGRGIKGQKARSGSNKMRPGFEGGQMPIYMRLGKQRGPYSKDAMPVGPHRTRVSAVNVRDLERFDGEVTPETLTQAGLIRNTRLDVKILGHGELTKKLTVSAHLFSASAREKIEGAGGSITWLRGEPKPRPPKRRERKAAPPAAEEPAAEVEEPPTDEPAAEPPVRDSGPGEGAPGEPGGSPAEAEAGEEEH